MNKFNPVYKYISALLYPWQKNALAGVPLCLSWLFCHESLGTAEVSIQFNQDYNTELCSLNFSSVYIEITSKHLHTQISTLPSYHLSFKCVSTPWTTSFPPQTLKAFWAAASYTFKHWHCHAVTPHVTNHPHKKKKRHASEAFYITQNRFFTINKQCLNSLTPLDKNY